MKYCSAGVTPRVNITTSRDGEDWKLAISDNGIGFNQQYARRIFGLFKRLHKDEYPGTGLGLAICQRIVERAGGRIWADGEEGRGSTFYVLLKDASTVPVPEGHVITTPSESFAPR